MKRFLYFFIAAVMCLSFSACSAKESALYEKYEDIINDLEEKDYQGALGRINELYQADEEENGANKEPDPEAEAFKALVPGKWLASAYDKKREGGVVDLTFSEDGTFTMGGQKLTWEITAAEPTHVRVMVNNGDTPAYSMYIEKDDDGYCTATLSKYTDERYTIAIGSYYRSAEYTPIEITMQNWEEYFEVVKPVTTNVSFFGEKEYLTVHEAVVFKEELGQVQARLCDAAIEFLTKDVKMKCTADLEAETYLLGDIIDPLNTVHPNIRTITFSDVYEIRRFGCIIGDFIIDTFPEDEIWYASDFTVIFVAGTVYVKNELK